MAGNDWMSRLQDGLPINRIAIPGTHDTGAYQPPDWYSRPMTFAQHVNIPTQLGYGIRVLDLRIGGNWKMTNYDLYHGPFQLPDSVDKVITAVITHLDNNPTEFIILLLKFEPWLGFDWSEHFNKYLNTALGAYLFRRPTGHDLPHPLRWPTVGELRKKVMVLSRVKQPHAYHYDTRAWNGNSKKIALDDVGGGLSAEVQDLYDKPMLRVKQSAIRYSLAQAKIHVYRKRSKTKLYINFTSYVKNGTQPREVGDETNQWLMSVSGDDHPMIGLICIDAAKADIVEHIYNQNAAYFM